MIYCILSYCIKFLINVIFSHVEFEKCIFCVYLKFKNSFKNDTLGNTKFDIFVYPEQGGLD